MPDIMNSTDIAFPHLGIYLKDVPKSFSVFGFEVALYGTIIGIGILAGILFAVHEAKRTGQNPERYWDFSLYAVIACIIGSRIYYVAFTWDYYKDHLLEIFNLRGGGLAIYGTVIMAFVTALVYTRIKKMSLPLFLDTGLQGLIIGQFIGRWGNFTNREAFGQYTDNLFAMRLPIEAVRPHEITESISAHITEAVNYIQVHPTFLYESLWNIGVFLFMQLYKSHKKFDGEIALLYLGGYGLGRFWVEGLRTDQLLIPGTLLPVSQLLGGFLFVLAVILDIVFRRMVATGRMKEATAGIKRGAGSVTAAGDVTAKEDVTGKDEVTKTEDVTGKDEVTKMEDVSGDDDASVTEDVSGDDDASVTEDVSGDDDASVTEDVSGDVDASVTEDVSGDVDSSVTEDADNEQTGDKNE